jgi:hypothetical protein
MEKTADYQYRVTKREGKLWLKLPGTNKEIPYDGRLPDCPPYLDEGGYYVQTLEYENDRTTRTDKESGD